MSKVHIFTYAALVIETEIPITECIIHNNMCILLYMLLQ